MSEKITRHWQLWAYVLTTAVGVGVTISTIRASEKRLDKFETLGTPPAQAAIRSAIELDRRVTILEKSSGDSQRLLERIDERTKNIVERLDRIERK